MCLDALCRRVNNIAVCTGGAGIGELGRECCEQYGVRTKRFPMTTCGSDGLVLKTSVPE
jgi:hypothetical protein